MQIERNEETYPSLSLRWESFDPRIVRLFLLIVAGALSLPSFFFIPPDVGLDPSWGISLHLASLEGKIFGQDFIFTYGPLGYLQTRSLVNKWMLLGYDCFVLGNLIFIYRSLLAPRPGLKEALVIIGLAVVTKTCLLAGASTVLFTILSFWIWHTFKEGRFYSVACATLTAVALFFGKVNYGIVLILLIPASCLGLLLSRGRRWCGVGLAVGFAFAITAGASFWHVDLPGYLRSGRELVAGYNEAMFNSLAYSSLAFELALVFLFAMTLIALRNWRRYLEPSNFALGFLVALGSMLFYKNAFTRADSGHLLSFHQGLPLLLGFWCVGWRENKALRSILGLSLLFPIIQLGGDMPRFGASEIARSTPLRYLVQLVTSPSSLTAMTIGSDLNRRYPELSFSEPVLTDLKKGSVDTIPWETSIAVANGLLLAQRPIPQSYCAFTLALDQTNATYLAGATAPERVLYTCARISTIDDRVAAWDESLTKRALIENYTLETECQMPWRLWPDDEPKPSSVFVLKHTSGARKYEVIGRRDVSLTLGQPLVLSDNGNAVFLEIEARRSLLGMLKGCLLPPSPLKVVFEYADGSSKEFRAILPILRTGVLVSQTLENADEVRNWLTGASPGERAVVSVRFQANSAWAFKTPLRGQLTEYRIVSASGN